MKYDQIRETAINSLFVLLTQPELTLPEQRIINDCATLLINGRTPEQVSKFEIELFYKIHGDDNG